MRERVPIWMPFAKNSLREFPGGPERFARNDPCSSVRDGRGNGHPIVGPVAATLGCGGRQRALPGNRGRR